MALSSGPAIYTLLVVNKSGGLIYNKDFAEVAKVALNDQLRIASIWHSLNAISTQLSPVPGCTGIELLEADTFSLHCLQTLTGTKFLLLVAPATPGVPDILQRVYELYADYVLKNPFYEVEQVIKCELFDEALDSFMRAVLLRPGYRSQGGAYGGGMSGGGGAAGGMG